MKLEQSLKEKIESRLSEPVKSMSSLSGGCISNAFKIVTVGGGSYLLKTNSGQSGDMFSKEAHGLSELRKPEVIRVPEVISHDSDYILTEFISPGNKSAGFFEDFGRRFAQMHRFTGESFGFYEDNYIGATPQKNVPSNEEKNSWINFFLNKRIIFQYKLAEKNGYASPELRKGISKLCDKIEDILSGSTGPCSVLHGDLWGGNYLVDEKGGVCIIDPAVYYGHREADLAMTKVFGGFAPEFYSAYNEAFPLDAGYEYRENIYKLYHILNHLNLFGRGYYSQALGLINYYL